MPCDAQILLLAKEPVAGRVKTRLTPPLRPDQAADVARAALNATLDAVRRSAVTHRVLVLEGTVAADGFLAQRQRPGALDERIARAFDDAWQARPLPMLLIGMDTPQITEVHLGKALATLLSPGVDAVLGQAEDGGWWTLGLRRPHPHLVRGILTSRPDTGRRQRRALVEAGLVVVDLPVLRDIDTVEDLVAVTAQTPDSAFAAAVAEVLG